jgi:hypothetical protein
MTNKNEVEKLVEEFQENNPAVHVFQERMIRTFTEEEYAEKSPIQLTDTVKKIEVGAGEILLFTEEKVGDKIKCSGIQITGDLDIRIWILDLNSDYHFSKTEFYEDVWKTNIREIFSIE